MPEGSRSSSCDIPMGEAHRHVFVLLSVLSDGVCAYSSSVVGRGGNRWLPNPLPSFTLLQVACRTVSRPVLVLVSVLVSGKADKCVDL
ncbi:hypothetical protein PAMP_014664 [Pampus punctatissimus]